MFVRKLFCIGGFIDGSLQKEFIEFMVDCQVLKFGDFVTKSGRKTPFFVNTGFYRTGAQLRRLGQYYAEAVNSKFGLDFDVLFGPGSGEAVFEGKHSLELCIRAAESITEFEHTETERIDSAYKKYYVKNHGNRSQRRQYYKGNQNKAKRR